MKTNRYDFIEDTTRAIKARNEAIVVIDRACKAFAVMRMFDTRTSYVRGNKGWNYDCYETLAMLDGHLITTAIISGRRAPHPTHRLSLETIKQLEAVYDTAITQGFIEGFKAYAGIEVVVCGY